MGAWEEKFLLSQMGASFFCFFSLHLCSITQLCLALCNPLDCSLLDSSVHGIFQARILERVAIFSSKGIFRTKDLNLWLLH